MDKFLALCCCFNAYFIGFRSIFISLESLLTESNINIYLITAMRAFNELKTQIYSENLYLTWTSSWLWHDLQLLNGFLEYSIWKFIHLFIKIKTKRYYDKISPLSAQIKQYKIDDFFYSYFSSMILTNISGCRKWISHFEEKKQCSWYKAIHWRVNSVFGYRN